MRKLILIIIVILGASQMMAQDVTDSKPKFTPAAEFGTGNDLEIGFRGQMNLHKFVSWDIVHAKYAADFTHEDEVIHEVTLETGVRGFTPTFGKTNLRVVGALDLGYGGSVRKSPKNAPYNPNTHLRPITSDRTNWTNHMALDVTVGLYVTKSLYIGYGLGLLGGSHHHIDHLARVGFDL